MIKGCNKRVIVMKETGSDMIEEAFFILRPSKDKCSFSNGDIMKHANSILEKNCYGGSFPALSMSVTQSREKKSPFSFFLGLTCGVLIASVIFFVF